MNYSLVCILLLFLYIIVFVGFLLLLCAIMPSMRALVGQQGPVLLMQHAAADTFAFVRWFTFANFENPSLVC